MSRQSPTGFAFSMLIEIAAVVIIVSLLPRFDLRPKASAAAPTAAAEFSPPSLLTNFQRPSFTDRPSPAPPLFEAPLQEREYVEQRLDQASQKLVDTVGTAVSSVASDLAQAIGPQPASLPSQVTPVQTLPPQRQVTLLPAAANPAPLPPPPGSFPTQPRAWLRY